jgi:hypothetical protein
LAGNASVRIAAEFVVSIEPPKACNNRQPIGRSAPRPATNGSSPPALDWQVDRSFARSRLAANGRDRITACGYRGC